MRVDQVKPIGNFLFMRLEPRREKIGSVYLPGNKTGVEIVGFCTAQVVASGEGAFEKREKGRLKDGVDLKGHLRGMFPAGCRVVYRDYMSTLLPVDIEDEGDYVFLNALDVDLVIGEDVVIGAWSDIEVASESA